MKFDGFETDPTMEAIGLHIDMLIQRYRPHYVGADVAAFNQAIRQVTEGGGDDARNMETIRTPLSRYRKRHARA